MTRTPSRAATLAAALPLLSVALPPAAAAPRLLVSAYTSDDVSLFSYPDGAPLGGLGAGATLDGVQATRVGPDGLLYVANEEQDQVLRYDRTTSAFVDVFVAAGSGGLDGPTGITWGPDGNLYVASFETDSVLKYDGSTGASLGTFVASGSGGLNGPDAGTTFGPDGHLYVPSYYSARILKYDGTSGASLGDFIQNLPRPRDLEFRDDGMVYVATDFGDDVRRYDAVSGASMGTFVTAGSGGLDGAYSLEFDGMGSLLVASLNTDQVLQYSAADGSFIGVFVDGAALGIDAPTWVTLVREDAHCSGMGLGAANPNRVRVHDGAGAPTTTDFLAYGAGAWGVNLAVGNLTAAERAQILTGPGPGAVFGPQVRAFLHDGVPVGKVNFYAYGTLKYGVNIAGAELDADGYDEILTGPGEGEVFGPHVRGFGFDATTIAPISKINFFAYQTLKYGVNVTGGDVDADGYAELLTGPGPGPIFGPQVRGWNHDGGAVTSLAKVNFNAFATSQYGVNVAGGDVDQDLYAEIAAAPGPGSSAGFEPRFLGFDYDGAAVSPLAGFDVTLPTSTLYGGRLALADVSGDHAADLLAGAGRDPVADATVRSYGRTLAAMLPFASFDPFPGSTYGVNPAGGALGF